MAVQILGHGGGAPPPDVTQLFEIAGKRHCTSSWSIPLSILSKRILSELLCWEEPLIVCMMVIALFSR